MALRSFLGDSQPGWYIARVTFTIEIEREDDGRWLAEVPALAGVMAYGQDRDEAVARVQALALAIADWARKQLPNIYSKPPVS